MDDEGGDEELDFEFVFEIDDDEFDDVLEFSGDDFDFGSNVSDDDEDVEFDSEDEGEDWDELEKKVKKCDCESGFEEEECGSKKCRCWSNNWVLI